MLIKGMLVDISLGVLQVQKQLKEERFILTSHKDKEVDPTEFSKKK